MVAHISPPTSAPAPDTGDRTADRGASRQEVREDAALVRRFNAGDESAFVKIVDRYHARMLQVAMRLLRNRADAAEIAQDTFIRAYRGLATFRGDSSLSTWLYRIALNLSRNRYWYYFRRCRHATLPLDAEYGDTSHASFADLVASDAPSPVQEAATNEFAAIVTACMEQLPASQREILTLRNVQQYSYDHISRTLGIRIGTAKSRIARARENLRSLLFPVYGDPTGAGAPLPAPWFESGRRAGLLPRAGS